MLNKKIIAFFTLFLMITSFAYAADANKYAYVDITKVFDEYQKTIDNDKTLQKAGEAKETGRNKIVEDVRKMKDEMELLSEDTKKTKQDAIDQKVRELQDYDLAARRELGEQRQKVVEEIFNDIDAVVKEYGKKKNYDFILNDKALIYNREDLDVTADILVELNKKYPGAKK